MNQTIKIWWRASLAVFNGMHELNLGLIAAGVAFYAMLAIFPAVAAVIALWGIVSDPAIVEAQLSLLVEFMPPEAFVILDDQVNRLVSGNSSALGWATVISTVAALWSTRAGVAALIRGLNAIYRIPNRTSLRQILVAFGMTLALVGVSLVALASVVIVPILLVLLPLGPLTQLALSSVSWLIALSVVLMGLSLIYRFGPNRRGHRPRWFTPGAVVAMLIWAAASYGFSYYLANFGKYNEIYGTLGAVIALLMWLYLSAYVVLLGGFLNAELDRAKRALSDQPVNTAPLPDPLAGEEAAGDAIT
ncbi:YihY/virulence factor BrkB family protein [Oceaniglobus ichthyenteri]|uniref:YihY/virulence factor BrkB family protein n=1 Tax=Oceaniglobus ichthyenteri TaxID=2136177 RepID=UPI000D3CB32B|nr:YihY/virulence factor BrkB family protein [Oceaniglobus ichthyenteri]